MKRDWKPIKLYKDIRFELWNHIAKITINRPEVQNAFRPIYMIVLTGEGDKAFCSGGDQQVKGEGGYIDEQGIPRLNVLDVQRKIRSLPKPVVAMVNGWAVGGGHVLHVICDLTIASDNARFGQVGPKVGSFDAGPRNMVSQPVLFGQRSLGNGPCQQSGAIGTIGRHHRGMVRNYDETQPHGLAHDQAGFECRTRRTSWFTGVCRQCHLALLPYRRSTGRQKRIP